MTNDVSYIIPASLLYEAASGLQPPERLCFVTGVKVHDPLGKPLIVLTNLVKVEASSSRVHATPDPASVLRAHRELLSLGQDIEGQFHSHPGRTIEATRASVVDFRTARRCWPTFPSRP